MKKIYITLLAIAAIGASQVVLADDRVIRPNTPATADVKEPPCEESPEYNDYVRCYNRIMIKNATCDAILALPEPKKSCK
jgi:hypothetical protein